MTYQEQLDARAARNRAVRLQELAAAVVRALLWLGAVYVALYPLLAAIQPTPLLDLSAALGALDAHHIFADVFYVQIVCCAVLLTNLAERRWHAETVAGPGSSILRRLFSFIAVFVFFAFMMSAIREHARLFAMDHVPLEDMINGSRQVLAVAIAGLAFETFSGWAGHK